MNRIAVHAAGDMAVRVARTLLAERGIRVGMFGDSPDRGRVSRITDLAGADVLIVECEEQLDPSLVDEAIERNIPIVLAADEPDLDYGDHVVIAGAANPIHVTIAVAAREFHVAGELIQATAAWTTPGRPLRAGTAVTFPEPVGPLWAVEAIAPPAPFPVHGLEAPTDSDYTAAVVRLLFGTGDGVEDVTYGVVDLRVFLVAAALAAAGLAASAGVYLPGVQAPADPDGVFLDAITRAGITVGQFRRS